MQSRGDEVSRLTQGNRKVRFSPLNSTLCCSVLVGEGRGEGASAASGRAERPRSLTRTTLTRAFGPSSRYDRMNARP
jgi:hypothetical protein